MARDTAIVQSFKQRLVPFAPSSKASKPSTPAAEPVSNTENKSQLRPKTPHPHSDDKQSPVLRLYPSKADDEKVAMAAFSKMFQEEQKALMAARQGMPADVPKSLNQDTTSTSKAAPQMSIASTDSISTVDMAKTMGKILPAAPTGLRRIKTGQVKTVTVAPPRPPKRANTSDVVGATAAVPAIKIRTGPLFKFANVGGAKAQEFEIVSGGPDGAGQAF